MRIIFRKLLFLFVLFVVPFVSSNAFAACQAITFSYGADGWVTSGAKHTLAPENQVNVVRYFKADATDRRYWFLDRNCTLGGSENALIPLNGSFNVGVPVGFTPLRPGQAFSSTEEAAENLEEGSTGAYTFSYNVEEKYMSNAVVTCFFQFDAAVCSLKSGITPQNFIDSVRTFEYRVVGNYLMSLKNSAGYDLNLVRLSNGQLITEYVKIDSAVNPFKVSPIDGIETTYYVDRSGNVFAESNRVKRVFSMPVISDVVRSGVVVQMKSESSRPTTNTVSLFNDSGVYEGEQIVTISNNVAYMLCSYSQEEDLSGAVAVSHCRFNTNVKTSLYNSVANKVYYPLEVYYPAMAGALAPGTFQLAYGFNGVNTVSAFVDYPCYKASIYGIEQRAANIAVSTSPVLYLYNKNGAWYSDSSCSDPLGDDNSFDIQINKTLGVPYLYGTDASAGLTGHGVSESYAAITGLPFMCNYRDGQTVVTCTWLVDKLLADTSYYPTDYAVLSSSIREIMSRRETDGSVLVILSPNVSGACYTLSVNLGSGVVINMYYDSGNKIWRYRSCTGEDITADGIGIAVSGTGNNIPVSFSTTSSDDVPQATIGNSYNNTTNVYVLYDAHKNSSSFTLKPTGAITANTTLYTAYDFPSSNAKSLVVTYSNQKQHLKNYYQIKIMENDSMPETIFYHDGSGYYDSSYNSISTTSFSVSLNDSVAKVPVIFQYTEVESPVTKSESNWGGVLPSFLYCDYDLVKSQRTMKCSLPSLNDTENRAYYVYSYAALDGRKLKVVGGAYPLTAYCNPLVLVSGYTERKTYYSQYYQDADEYRIRWYSDDTCTTELTQNVVNGVNYPFRLPLVQYNGIYAVPFLFNTTGSSAATIEADSSISNSGPIYCVYNSAVNSADCMFNWVSGYGPGGLLGAPVSTAIYFGSRSAKVLDDKTLLISNTFSSSSNTTVIEYFIPEFCSQVALSVIGGAEKIYYTNGVEWFGDASCKNPQGLVLPDAPEGQVILYFKQKCSLLPNVIDVSDDSITYTVSADVPCTYSSDTDVTSCSFNLSEITTDRAYCANDFAMKCNPQPSAGCELEVTNDGDGSIRVDYTNCCLAGYHDENGVSSTLPVGQTSCK